MSSAEWSSKWNNLPALAELDFDMAYELLHNLLKRGAPLACQHAPIANTEWAYGTIGSITSDGTTITLTSTDIEPPLDAPGILSGRVYVDIDAEQGSPKGREHWHVCGANTQSVSIPGSTTFIEVHDDGRWTLNGNLSRFGGKKLGTFKSHAKCWADRRFPRPVWTLDPPGTAHPAYLITAGAGTFTLTVNTFTTEAIDNDATAEEVAAALAAIGILGEVRGDPGGPYTFISGVSYDNNFSGTGATVEEIKNKLFCLGKSWPLNHWVTAKPADLMVQVPFESEDEDYAAAGNWRWTRLPVTASDADSITFAEVEDQKFGPRGTFYLTKSGAWWMINQDGTLPKFEPFKWFTGLMDNYWTRHANDLLHIFGTIRQLSYDMPFPRPSISLMGDEGTPLDVYLGPEDEDLPDTLLQPDYWHCLAAVLYGLHALSGYYILGFTASDADHFVSMMPASVTQAMRASGGHYTERTIVSVAVDGTATLSEPLTLPDGATERGVTDPSKQVWVMYYDDTGRLFQNKTFKTVPEPDKLYGSFTNAPVALGGDVGRKLGISFGPLRYHPRMVRRLRDCIVFRPQPIEEGGFVTGFQDPPSVLADDGFGIGDYVLYPKSTRGCEYHVNGALIDSGRELLDGDRYAFVGHNQGDPTGPAYLDEGLGMKPHPWHGLRINDSSAAPGYLAAADVSNSASGRMWLEPDSSGVIFSVHAAGTQLISAADNNAHLWANGQSTPRKVHEFTATTGSTTTIDCADKAPEYGAPGYDPYWRGTADLDLMDYVQTGYDGNPRFVGMTVRVRIHEADPEDPEDEDVWETRLITDVTFPGSTARLTISAGTAVTNGMLCRVREPSGSENDGTGPGVLSYWRDAIWRVTSAADGSEHDWIIEHHDDKTFFPRERVDSEDDYIPAPGDTWRIICFRPGDVIERDSEAPGGWKRPAGVAAGASLKAIEPTYVQDYGAIWHKGDGIAKGGWAMVQQLKDWIDVLHRMEASAQYDAGEEDNVKHVAKDQDPYDPENTDWATIKSQAATAWGSTSPANDNRAPEIISAPRTLTGVPVGQGELLRVYNRLKASPFKCPRLGLSSRQFEIWVYPTFDEGDKELGTITFFLSPSGEYYHQHEFYSDGLPVQGGTGASLLHRKWAKVYSQITAEDDVSVLIGDDSHPLPTWPASTPSITDLNASPDGHTITTIKGAYIKRHFAVVDWQSAFDVM